MFENTIELAENKLLLLYIIKKINYPISNMQLSEIVLENNLMNYFIFQQYLSELIASNFLILKEEDEEINIISLSDTGSRVLNLFYQRISSYKKNIIDEYIKSKIDTIKKEHTIHADYTVSEDGSFLVELKAMEGDYIIINLKLSVASKKQAQDLCKRWKDNSSDIYKEMLKVLFE